MDKQETITYKWTGDGWVEWERRVVLERPRGVKYNKHNPRPQSDQPKRYRPCWFNNGVEQVLELECPGGWVKGKLQKNYKSRERRWPCVRCGRAFYVKRDFIDHGCINAK